MNPNVDYCTMFQHDSNFGAVFDALSCRWTSSCLVDPEYKPGNMRMTIIHALSYATASSNRF